MRHDPETLRAADELMHWIHVNALECLAGLGEDQETSVVCTLREPAVRLEIYDKMEAFRKKVLAEKVKREPMKDPAGYFLQEPPLLDTPCVEKESG